MKNFLRLSHLLSSPRISDDFRQGKPDGLEIHSKFFPHSSRILLLSVFSAEFRPECKAQTHQSAICFFLFVYFNFFMLFEFYFKVYCYVFKDPPKTCLKSLDSTYKLVSAQIIEQVTFVS